MTIAHHGDFALTDAYWECECQDNYIHPSSTIKCPICGCHRDNDCCPDARVVEVLYKFPHLTKADL